MFTPEGALNIIRNVAVEKGAMLCNFGQSETLTLDVVHIAPEDYSITVIRQNAVFDDMNRRYKDKILHTYRRVTDDMLPYVIGKIFAYDFKKAVR